MPMPIRALIWILAAALLPLGHLPLAAQTEPGRVPAPASALLQAPPPAPTADRRWEAAFERERGVAEVTRARWVYPAAGAAVGAAAGLAHGYAITREDYIGWPVEPMHFLPVAYGAVGAFLGLLVDNSERERKAARR